MAIKYNLIERETPLKPSEPAKFYASEKESTYKAILISLLQPQIFMVHRSP